ncbi:MAG: transporter substrate-binding domain-containing protein [Oscillospiraceae bacterium]|jgi:polar amino acid transport system substrate-binding protein|nr:transporter substrate-binding domain-containing protein [Oscillospiraceae bacterium]
MKRFFSSALAIALVILLVVSAAACGGATGKLKKIKSAGKITVYTDPNFSPFEFLGANSEIVGVDVEIAKAIAAELGVTADLKEGKFDSILMSLKGGKGDVAISGFTITAERRENVDFSDPYINSVQYLILPEGSDVAVLEDLAGKTVGVAKGYTGQLLLDDETSDEGTLGGANTTVNAYNSAMEAVLDLNTGRIVAVVMDEYVAKNLVASNAGLVAIELRYSDGSLASEEYGVAVPKGNEDLLAVINTVIARLKSEQKIEQWVVDFSS